MEQYTDDERVEDIKKWWKENGASILIGLVLGLVAIFGWRYWTSYRDSRAEAASQAYDTFLVAVANPEQAGAARDQGQALLSGFPRSPYAALAALHLAKLAAEGADYPTARQWLEWVITNAQLDELKDIARLRLARVSLDAGQVAEAEKLLDAITAASLNTERETLRGDLYVVAQQPDKARTAYAAALAAGGDRLLQFKLDNLTLATPETVVPVPTTPPPPVEPPATAPDASAAEPKSEAAAATAPAVSTGAEATPVPESAPVTPVPPASVPPAPAPLTPPAEVVPAVPEAAPAAPAASTTPVPEAPVSETSAPVAPVPHPSAATEQ